MLYQLKNFITDNQISKCINFVHLPFIPNRLTVLIIVAMRCPIDRTSVSIIQAVWTLCLPNILKIHASFLLIYTLPIFLQAFIYWPVFFDLPTILSHIFLIIRFMVIFFFQVKAKCNRNETSYAMLLGVSSTEKMSLRQSCATCLAMCFKLQNECCLNYHPLHAGNKILLLHGRSKEILQKVAQQNN